MGAKISVAVVVTYLVMLLLIVVVVAPDSSSPFGWVLYLLLGITVLFLVRYLSTRYSMDDTHFVAWRVLGGRRIPLEEVRAIEYASLRDLAPTQGAFGAGSFGWRGRMFSPVIGEFESVYTDAARGLLVTAGAYPLYVSPRDREAFARELSRRVRSYGGGLLKDVGRPGAGVAVSSDATPAPPT